VCRLAIDHGLKYALSHVKGDKCMDCGRATMTSLCNHFTRMSLAIDKCVRAVDSRFEMLHAICQGVHTKEGA